MKKVTLAILILINILLIVAMVIHVNVAMEKHAQQLTNSAPASVNWIYAIYYIIPLIVIDVAYFLISKKRS